MFVISGGVKGIIILYNIESNKEWHKRSKTFRVKITYHVKLSHQQKKWPLPQSTINASVSSDE